MRNLLSFVSVLALVFSLNVSNAFAKDGDPQPENGCDHEASCNGGNGGQGGAGGNGGQGGAGGQGGLGGDALSLQGQAQGQVGIVAPVITDVNTNANTAANTIGNTGLGNTFSPTASASHNGNTSATVGNTSASAAATQTLTDNDTQTVRDSGNSDVNIGGGLASKTLSPEQSQDQSQIGVNEQGQSQFGVNAQKNGDFSGDIFTVEGDTTLVEAPKIPVNSAAASIGGTCNQGVAFTNDNASFSAGSGNPVCDLLAVARGYAAVGDLKNATSMLDEAAGAARFRKILGFVRGTLTLGLL